MRANLRTHVRRAQRWTLAVTGAALLASAGGCGLAKEGRAWLYGLEAYLYGFPLIMMDLTKDAATAVPTAGEITAPINQFAVMTKYPDARARERRVQPDGAQLLAEGSRARRHVQGSAGEEGAVSLP